MTKDFALREAKRRTKALGRKHYVFLLKSKPTDALSGWMVNDRLPVRSLRGGRVEFVSALEIRPGESGAYIVV